MEELMSLPGGCCGSKTPSDLRCAPATSPGSPGEEDAAPAVSRLVPYFGAKGMAGLNRRIVAEIGPHRAYWEPCCGSMAVLAGKPVASMETVNDLNGDLINLARVVRDPTMGPMLYRRLRRTLMHEEIFRESAERWKAAGRYDGDALDLDRAYDYFVSSWAGRNGVTGTASYNQGFSARYTKNGGHAATRFRSATSSMLWWRKRLDHVTILRRDLFGILPKIEDADGVVIYLDPPYVEKGASYIHDFEGEDHARLHADLARFKKTRVVVSYYDHPLVRELYAGWTVVDCETTKALANQGQRDAGRAVVAPEVLLINGPSFTAEDGLFGGAA